MHNLHPNQSRILEHLLSQPGGASLDQLGSHLGLTRTAVQQHVHRLQDLGLITYRDDRGAVGRPRRHYLLTEAGIEAFPKKYAWLAQALLARLARQWGPGQAEAFMTGLAEDVAASLLAAPAPGETPDQRMKRVAALLDDLGYRAALTAVHADGGGVIEAVNCVYHSVAKEHPELCRFDVRLVEAATGMPVRLDSCIARGGAVCRFCVHGRPKA